MILGVIGMLQSDNKPILGLHVELLQVKANAPGVVSPVTDQRVFAAFCRHKLWIILLFPISCRGLLPPTFGLLQYLS